MKFGRRSGIGISSLGTRWGTTDNGTDPCSYGPTDRALRLLPAARAQRFAAHHPQLSQRSAAIPRIPITFSAWSAGRYRFRRRTAHSGFFGSFVPAREEENLDRPQTGLGSRLL